MKLQSGQAAEGQCAPHGTGQIICTKMLTENIAVLFCSSPIHFLYYLFIYLFFKRNINKKSQILIFGQERRKKSSINQLILFLSLVISVSNFNFRSFRHGPNCTVIKSLLEWPQHCITSNSICTKILHCDVKSD